MQNFRNLNVWRESHELTLSLYRTTKSFPREELFGLTSQMRRAAASIGANIAEGCGRKTDTDFGRFLHIAMGSACELEYQLLLAHDLDLLEQEHYQQLASQVVDVKRMLASLLVKLRADS